MVIITTPNFLRALDTLNNLVPIVPKTITESQLRPLTSLEPEIKSQVLKGVVLSLPLEHLQMK